ncbi:MAG TPA: Ig-like domain-containing protein [Jatrophihabitantaceae bacterium]
MCGLATSVALAVAGTPGHDPANGSWVGGLVLSPGPEPLVLWRLPGAGGRFGTCIQSGSNGPLRGTYTESGIITDPVYAELNHLYAQPGTSDVRLAELSALNSAKYDLVDKHVQWSYLVNGQGATSVADAGAMLAHAADLAGPYTVSVSWPTDADLTGHTYTATVTVHSAKGHPVPGARVTLTATNAVVATPTVTTDANGLASTRFSIPIGTSTTFTIRAAAQSWTTLQTWSAAGEQTMLVAGSPGTQTGQHTGPVQRTRPVRLVKAAVGDHAQSPVPGYVYDISDDHGHVIAPAVTTGATATAAPIGDLQVGARYNAREVRVPAGAKLYIPTASTVSFTVPAGTTPWTFVATDPTVPHPTIVTHASADVALVGEVLADDVDVSGDDGEDGVIDATLHGPVAAPTGRCSDITLDQYQAAPAHTVSVAIAGNRTEGNGRYRITGPPVPAAGCWGWSEKLTLTPSGASATSAPTAAHESTLVRTPSVTTSISAQRVTPGATLTDRVIVDGLNGHTATLTVTLVGPVSPTSDGCAGVSSAQWHRAALGTTASAGRTLEYRLAADGTYVLGRQQVREQGCYTYVEVLTPIDVPQARVTTPPGLSTETALVQTPAAAHPPISAPRLAQTGTAAATQLAMGVGALAAGVALLSLVRRRP